MAARLCLLLLLVLPLYLFAHRGAWEMREEVRTSTESGYVMPSKFSRVLALEHKGLLSDYLFLQVVSFYGERVMLEEDMSGADWDYIVAGLDAVTDLDPYFWDPYLLAEGLLAWDAGRVEEANRILEKGRRHQEDDWQFPFYLGFNHFFFLKDFEKGSAYLMEASKLPGSPNFLPNLAARIGYYGAQSKIAIIFLKGMLIQTEDERLRARLEKRLSALEKAASLEEMVELFKKERGRSPASIGELLSMGYLRELPVDPYGGDWVILETGRVFSTSRFAEKPQ